MATANWSYFVTYNEGREYPAAVQSELQAWIDECKAQGWKVIYFGQGSFSHHAKETFIVWYSLSIDVDGIALSSTVDDQPHPIYLKVIQELDQMDIFPQCEVIVHHGGAGSASQAIRSGHPSICLPSMPFQEVWGAKIEEYGASALLLPDVMMSMYAQNKSNNLLMAAIQSSLQPTVKDKAVELGAKAWAMSKALGIHLAAVMIEYHLQTLMQKNHISHHDSMENNDGAKSTNQEEMWIVDVWFHWIFVVVCSVPKWLILFESHGILFGIGERLKGLEKLSSNFLYFSITFLFSYTH